MTLPSPHAFVQSATVSFDRVSDIYDSTRGLPPGVSEQITETILKIVSPTPDTKFFETGIGTGRIALPIIQKGYSYTGIDISEKMLDELRSKLQGINHRATLYAGDAANLPFGERSFDVAITVHVFHLIANWQKALAEDQAIQTLVENYGLRESEIVVFGDQINDIKMFKIADRAIAVANADAKLKRYATLVIGSNTEDSVVKYIHQDFCERIIAH
ncbi:HAD hydrolase family protein [Scytonema hofmannii]|uniref:HAD hydrolase family protein n=1 Tax=Scytonema hofmannii TaxID=34078 RepID=UPI0003464CF4|nr:HAD hydrolase family protein [Scytonema hofmannii]